MTGIPNKIAESRKSRDPADGFKIHRPQGHEDSTSSEAIKIYDASAAPAPAPAQRKAQQFNPSLFIHSSASISDCGTYRYSLDRVWDRSPEARQVAWIMLNPSTADATHDDPTIRRCIDFSRRWGFGGFTVRNLFALRATNPRELFVHADPVGPENIFWLYWLAGPRSPFSKIVCAWGDHGTFKGLGNAIAQVLRRKGAELVCLGVTKGGHPRHPLYLRADAELIPFAPREGGAK